MLQDKYDRLAGSRHGAKLTGITASAFTIPTDAPESDGTIAWTSTTLVLVQLEAGGKQALGYTYGDASNAALIRGVLAEALSGHDVFDIPACHQAMRRAVRNLGNSGLAATAISAVDAALWDLKAKLLDLPLVRLLGQMRDEVPVYGSGGFTSYDDGQLRDQLAGWVSRDGCRWVKMKVGRDPAHDAQRMHIAREAIGDAQLYIDANGAFTPRQALAFARTATQYGVHWFEEPVSSDDLAGLRFLREHAPATIEIAAGEYVYRPDDLRAMLEYHAVDVQQADVSRCGGVTGFLAAGYLCDTFHIDLSGHCAPSLHLHVACAVPRFRHLEWFHDHVRIEQMLFDGAPNIVNGCIRPDASRPGLGLEWKAQDAAAFKV